MSSIDHRSDSFSSCSLSSSTSDSQESNQSTITGTTEGEFKGHKLEQELKGAEYSEAEIREMQRCGNRPLVRGKTVFEDKPVASKSIFTRL